MDTLAISSNEITSSLDTICLFLVSFVKIITTWIHVTGYRLHSQCYFLGMFLSLKHQFKCDMGGKMHSTWWIASISIQIIPWQTTANNQKSYVEEPATVDTEYSCFQRPGSVTIVLCDLQSTGYHSSPFTAI